MSRRRMLTPGTDLGGAVQTRVAGARNGRRTYRWSWWLLPVAVVFLLLIGQPAPGKMAAEEEPYVPTVQAASVTPGVPARAHLEAQGSERVWVVAAGDTLWTVARQVAPGQDPRRTVEVLRQVNGLRSAALRVGQHLVIPAELTGR